MIKESPNMIVIVLHAYRPKPGAKIAIITCLNNNVHPSIFFCGDLQGPAVVGVVWIDKTKTLMERGSFGVPPFNSSSVALTL